MDLKIGVKHAEAIGSRCVKVECDVLEEVVAELAYRRAHERETSFCQYCGVAVGAAHIGSCRITIQPKQLQEQA